MRSTCSAIQDDAVSVGFEAAADNNACTLSGRRIVADLCMWRACFADVHFLEWLAAESTAIRCVTRVSPNVV